MKKEQPATHPLRTWLEKIDAKTRVKAVCKPCWELKYCPYGPMVEEFPTAKLGDEQGCRIFGHVCPVFTVAEPFTETKELRNISRTIPRPVQFRVLKRENQICRRCGAAVKDEDIHFDHIIPWSKGGSSDEHNVQLLCSACNRQKSDAYEAQHLVKDFREHVTSPASMEVLDFLFFVVDFYIEFFGEEGRLPVADDFANRLNRGDKGSPEEDAGRIVADLDAFFKGKRPRDVPAKIYKALRLRWGFEDNSTYTLRSVAEEFEIDTATLLDAEIALVRRLGFNVAVNSASRRKWLRR